LNKDWEGSSLEVSDQLYDPATLPPIKRLDVVDEENNSAPSGNRIPVFQPITCHCTDWAIHSYL